MTGTRNPSRKYFKRNQPYFYKSADNWEEWDTDESYDRTFFIGIDDTNPADIDVALYMIWGGKPVAAVGSKVLDTVSEVVDTAKLLETEIQSILKEVQELSAKVAQSAIDIEQAITEMNALVDRCEGILDGAEAARDLAKDWANKMNGTVDGTEYSAKYYANEAKNSETAAAGSASTASSSATTATEQATAAATSAEQAATSASTAASYASTAHIDASGAANSAQAAQDSATSAANSATNAANSETNSANSAATSAASAQAAQNALNEVNGLIATPIGTIFQSIYVDESLDIARRLNGQLISSTKFTGFRTWLNDVQTATPSLFTTETNWQSEKTNSKLGQCGKFVIDDTAGTIRLPCVVNAQGLVDLSLIGGIKSESLPNHYHVQGASASIDAGVTGRYGKTDTLNANTSHYDSGAGGATTYGYNTSGVYGSSTYQDNAPVQQEAVQYPYCIVVATGVEETLPAIREYEINNPFFFGQSMYSDIAPNNASWLASNGQWNAKSVYPDYYDWLVGQMNAGVSGFVASTATYTDYDFVINTADQTFRLPLLNGEEDLNGNVQELISSSSIEYTLPKNGTVKVRGESSSDSRAIVWAYSTSTSDADHAYSAGTLILASAKGKKGDLVHVLSDNCINVTVYFTPAVGNGSLYFYVGDTVQDASLINAGAILGQLANKVDTTLASVDNTGNVAATNLNSKGIRTVIETYRNGNNWYRVWSDGWIEQGSMGVSVNATAGVSFVINYFIPFSVSDYQMITMTPFEPDTNDTGSNLTIIGRTANNFTGVNVGYGRNPLVMSWYACGY